DEQDGQRQRQAQAGPHHSVQQRKPPPPRADAVEQVPNHLGGTHAVLAAIRLSAASSIATAIIAYCQRCCRSSCCRAPAAPPADGAVCQRATACVSSSADRRAGSDSRGSTLMAIGPSAESQTPGTPELKLGPTYVVGGTSP